MITTMTEAGRMLDTRPVLVVSGDRSRAEHLAEALRGDGGTVTTETHGAAAAAMVAGTQGDSPGLLVLDVSLPELDLQRLREALGESAPPPESLDAVERRQSAAMPRPTRGNWRQGRPPPRPARPPGGGRRIRVAGPRGAVGEDPARWARARLRDRGIAAAPQTHDDTIAGAV